MLRFNQSMMSRRAALKMGAGFAAAGLAGRGAFAETDISPEIDGIFCDGGQDAAGAAKAMLAAGRKLVPITGDDYNGILKIYDQHHEDNPDLKLGLVSEPTWESTLAVRTALKLLAGEDAPKQQIIQPTLIDNANYAQYVKRDLPDGVFVDTDLTDAELAKIFH